MKVYSVRWQIIVPALLILVVGFFTVSYLLTSTVTNFHTQTIQNSLSPQLLTFSHKLESQWQETTSDHTIQQQAEELAGQLQARVTIIAVNGKVLAETSPTPLEDTQLYQSEIQQALTTTNNLHSELDESTSPPSLFITVPIRPRENIEAVLRIIYPLHDLEPAIHSIQKTLWISSLILLAITTISLFYQSNLQGRRLNKILAAIDQISQGNRTIKIETGSRDDVGNLAHNVNLLAENLEEEFQFIKNEQAKLNAVLAQMNEGVVILDDSSTIILANEAVLNIFDFSDVDVKGLRLVRVIRNHHIVELWEEFQETGEDQAALLELTESNKFVQTYLTPLGPNLPGYSLFYFQDLTKIRKLEKVRRDFISNISHELRTPLASLKALSDTLQISMQDDPEASDRFLKRMNTEIDALAQMVSELLELSRIESRQVPIELAPIDANKILGQASDRLIIQAEREQISLKIKYTKSPAIILVDGKRIEQVLVNIIHNAIKFTPPKGKIKCSIYLDNDEVIFKIKDNGQGISSEDLPRIFERFYKSKRQNSSAGTGLGLAIAKHLTEANGGRIWAESKYGEGATFYISFKKNNESN